MLVGGGDDFAANRLGCRLRRRLSVQCSRALSRPPTESSEARWTSRGPFRAAT